MGVSFLITGKKLAQLMSAKPLGLECSQVWTQVSGEEGVPHVLG